MEGYGVARFGLKNLTQKVFCTLKVPGIELLNSQVYGLRSDRWGSAGSCLFFLSAFVSSAHGKFGNLSDQRENTITCYLDNLPANTKLD